jgi:hypothetical protein
VLHTLRDVRQVDPHEGRDSLNVAEPIPTLPASHRRSVPSGGAVFDERLFMAH